MCYIYITPVNTSTQPITKGISSFFLDLDLKNYNIDTYSTKNLMVAICFHKN